MARKAKLPSDPNQKAKSVVDLATSDPETTYTSDGKNAAAVSLGRKETKSPILPKPIDSRIVSPDFTLMESKRMYSSHFYRVFSAHLK